MPKQFTAEDFKNLGIEESQLDSLRNLQPTNNITRTAQANIAMGSGILGGNLRPESLSLTPEAQNFWDNELLALNQSTLDKWGNGVGKFAGKVGLYTVGNLAGLAYGLPKAITSGDLTQFYNNDFMKMLDRAEEGLDKALPNYVSALEREYGVFRSMGTSNFWANDVLGGMAFVVGAVTSEAIAAGLTTATLGGASPIQAGITARLLSKATKSLKGINKTSKIADVGLSKLAGGANKVDNILGETLKTGRQFITGAGYEAGVEARHFLDETKQNFIDNYITNNGTEPTVEEVAAFMDKAHTTANALFAGNLALVGGTNILTLPKTFGKSFTSTLPVDKKIAETSPVGEARNLIREFVNPTSLKKTASNNWDIAYNTWNKSKKIAYKTGKVVKTPFYEGIVEEGGQGVMSRAALDYMSKKYSAEGAIESYNMWDALTTAIGETYGDLDNTEFWKEVTIGMIIGGIGAPTFTSANLFKDGWQGTPLGSWRENNRRLDAASEFVAELNSKKMAPILGASITKNNTVYETNKAIDDAITNGDMWAAKNAENAQLISNIYTHRAIGQLDALDTDTTNAIDSMSLEEFQETFGYNNLRQEELQERKDNVVKAFREKIKSVSKSADTAERIIGNSDLKGENDYLGNNELAEALTYNIESVKDLDLREKTIASELSELIGMDNRTISEAIKANRGVVFSKNLLETYKKEISKYNRYLKMSSKEDTIAKHEGSINKYQSKIDAQKIKIDSLLEAERVKRIESPIAYNYDIDEFEKAVNSVMELDDTFKKAYELNPEIEYDYTQKLNDLIRIANQRENFTKEIQSLMSREGSKRFSDDLKEIKESSWKITKDQLIARYKEDLLELAGKRQDVELANTIVEDVTEEQTNSGQSDIASVKDTSNENFNKLKNKAYTYEEEYKQQAKNAENVQEYLNKLVSVKKALEKSKDEFSENIREEYNTLLASINDKINALADTVSKFKEGSNLGTEKILNNIEGLVRVVNTKERINNIIDFLSNKKDIKYNLSIRKGEYKKSGELVYPQTSTGEQIYGPIQIMLGDGNGSGYTLYYQDTLLGGITRPDKFYYNGRPLNVENDAELSALGVDSAKRNAFRNYYYKAKDLFDKIDSGNNITSEQISDVFTLSTTKPGFTKIGSDDNRKILSTFYEQSPEYRITVGDKTGLLIKRNEEFYIYDGVTSEKVEGAEVNNINSKLKTEILSKLGQHVLVVPNSIGEYTILGLDYPLSSEFSSEELNSRFLSILSELENTDDEILDKRRSNSGYVTQDTEVFVTLHNKVYPTSRMNVEIAAQRKLLKNEEYSKPYLTVKISGVERDSSQDFLEGILTRKEGELFVVGYKNKTKVETPFTKEVFIDELNNRLEGYGYKKTKEPKQDLVDLIYDIDPKTNKPKRIVYVANIKSRTEVDTIKDLELAAEPKESELRLKPSFDLNQNYETVSKDVETDSFVSSPETSSKADDPFNNSVSIEELPKNIQDALNKQLKAEESKSSKQEESKGEQQQATPKEEDDGFVSMDDDEFLTLFSGKKDKKEDSKPSDDDFVFSFNTYDGKPITSLNEATKILSNILPIKSEDNPDGIITVKDISELQQNLVVNGIPMGLFTDSIIYLNKDVATDKTVYHEAFHAVFRALIPKSERGKILNELKLKPKKSELNDLKTVHPSYSYKTDEELTEIWLEEKLADKFAKYSTKSTPTTYIGRLFEKIKKWFRALVNSDRTQLTAFFDSILNGQYRNAAVQEDLAGEIAFSLLRIPEEDIREIKSKASLPPRSSLTRLESNRIISRVAQDAVSLMENNTIGITEALNKSIKNVAKFYSPENWVKDVARLFKNNHKDRAIQLADRISDMGNAISDSFNQELIKKEVIKIIQTINADLYDSQEDSDTNEDYNDKHIGSKGGFKNLTSAMKSIFLTTNYASDEFSIGLTQEDLEDDRNQVPVNMYRTYYNFQKALVDIKPQNMLYAIEEISEYDNEMRAVYSKIVSMIKSEVGIDKDINEYTISELERSNTFNGFVSNFTRTRYDISETIYDVEKNNYRIVSANQKDAARVQLQEWSEEYTRLNNNPFTVVDNLNKLKIRYEADAPTLLSDMDNIVKEVKVALKDNLGMELHPNYIKWSVITDNLDKLKNHKKSFEKTNINSPLIETLDKFLKFQKTFDTGINSINAKFASKSTANKERATMFDLIVSKDILQNPKVNNRNPYGLKDVEIEKGSKKVQTGARTRLRNIAAANAKFDPTVRPTSFQNVEGNNVWDISYNSYYTEIYNLFKTPEFKRYLSNIEDSNWEDLKTVLSDNDIIVPDHFIELYHNSFVNNPLSFENLEELFNEGISLKSTGGMVNTDLDNNNKNKNDFRDAKTWKHLDAKGKLVSNMALFANSINEESSGYTYYNYNVNEGKATTLLVKLPYNSYITKKGTLTPEAIKALSKLVKEEFDRIKLEVSKFEDLQSGNGLVINNYNYDPETGSYDYKNDENNLRAYDFLNFKWIEELDPTVYKKMLRAARSKRGKFNFETELEPVFNTFLENTSQELLDILVSPSFKALIKGKEGYTNSTLPSFFFDSKGELNKNTLSNFIINDYIQGLAFNNMLDGSIAFGKKGFSDFVKRNAGKIADGPSLGRGQTNIAIFDNDANQRIPGVDDTDAQSYTTEAWEVNTYMKALGKLKSKNVRDIIKRKRKGYTLTKKEYNILKSNGALSQSKKLVGKDLVTYLKTSVSVIERAETSYVKRKDRKILDSYYDQLFELEETGAPQEDIRIVYEKIQSYWNPLPNREQLHNILNDMELNNIGIFAAKSAIKEAQINVSSIGSDGKVGMNPYTINNRFIREQVNTDNIKEKIVHGTQLIQLIWSEQDPNVKVEFRGHTYTLKELQSMYKKAIAERVESGMIDFKNTIFENADDGKLTKLKYEELYRSFKKSQEKSSPNPYLVELFSTDIEGKPVYNPNFTGVSAKFYQLFLAYASEDVLKHKVNGMKYTLVSDMGYQVMRNTETGEILRTDEFRNFEGTVNTDLLDGYEPSYLKYDETTGIAEAIISKNVANMFNLKKGDAIPEHVSKQLGFRIPTQDKHSMIKLKIVDFLPATKMNSIVVHPKVIELSGADFDIDSLFTRLYAARNGQRFGSYLENGKISDAILDLRKSKKVLSKLKDYLYKTKFSSVVELMDSLADEDFTEENTKEEFVDKILKAEFDMAVEKFYEKEGLYLEEDKLKKNNYKQYSVIVSNIENYKKSGFRDIKPITIEEHNNMILDMEYEFVNNEGNRHIAHTPASFNIMKGSEKVEGILPYWESNGLNYSTESSKGHDIVSKLKAIIANDAGNAGIGPAALSNVAMQNLINSNAKIQEEITIFGKDGFNSFTDDNGMRVNDSISTLISAMTDNAKELLSSKLNLNINTIGTASVMFGLGIDYKTTFNALRQPSFTMYSDLLTRQSSPLKTKRDRKSLKKIMKSPYEYILNELGFTEDLSVLDEINIELTEENLLEALKYSQELPNTLDSNTYFAIQYKSLQEIMKAKNIADEIRDYSKILSLIKGFKEDPAKIDLVEDIIIDLTGGGKLLDWSSIIENNVYVATNIEASEEIKEGLGKFLIPYSELGKEITKSLKDNGVISKFENSDTIKSILRNMSAYLMIRTRNQNQGTSYKIEDLFNDELFDEFDKIKNETTNPESILYNNAFLKSLSKSSRKFGDRFTKELIVNTRTVKDPDLVASLLDSFKVLYTYPEYRNFAIKLVNHLILRDALVYKNNSYLANIDPKFLKGIISELDTVQEAFDNKENVKKVLKTEFNSLKKEFIELYLLDYDNKNLRRSTDIGFLRTFASKQAHKTITTKSDDTRFGFNINTNSGIDLEYVRKETTNLEEVTFVKSYGDKLGFPLVVNVSRDKTVTLKNNQEVTFKYKTPYRLIRVIPEHGSTEWVEPKIIGKNTMPVGVEAVYEEFGETNYGKFSTMGLTVDELNGYLKSNKEVIEAEEVEKNTEEVVSIKMEENNTLSLESLANQLLENESLYLDERVGKILGGFKVIHSNDAVKMKTISGLIANREAMLKNVSKLPKEEKDKNCKTGK